MCGVAAGDSDQFHPGLKIRLTMGHIIDQIKGGTDTPGTPGRSVRIAMKVSRFRTAKAPAALNSSEQIPPRYQSTIKCIC